MCVAGQKCVDSDTVIFDEFAQLQVELHGGEIPCAVQTFQCVTNERVNKT